MRKKYQDAVDDYYMDENQRNRMKELRAQTNIKIARAIRDEFVSDKKLLELADFHLCNKIKLLLDSKDLSTAQLLALYDLIPCVGLVHMHETISRLAVKARQETESELERLIEHATEPCKKVLLSAQG